MSFAHIQYLTPLLTLTRHFNTPPFISFNYYFITHKLTFWKSLLWLSTVSVFHLTICSHRVFTIICNSSFFRFIISEFLGHKCQMLHLSTIEVVLLLNLLSSFSEQYFKPSLGKNKLFTVLQYCHPLGNKTLLLKLLVHWSSILQQLLAKFSPNFLK